MQNPLFNGVAVLQSPSLQKGLPYLPVFISLMGMYGLHPLPAALYCTKVLIDSLSNIASLMGEFHLLAYMIYFPLYSA